jgi:hypothetical protein
MCLGDGMQQETEGTNMPALLELAVGECQSVRGKWMGDGGKCAVLGGELMG